MSSDKLLPGSLDCTLFYRNCVSSRGKITPFPRSGSSLAKVLRKSLLASTALIGGLLLHHSQSLALSPTIIIEGGNTETVIGTGGGTQVSPWVPLGLTVGRVGNGTLNISAGGLLTTSSVVDLGQQNGFVGTVTLSGTNSTWNSSSHIRVGRAGQGVLNISAGGMVSTPNSVVYIGNLNNSEGWVTVTGVGSELVSRELYVGDNGTGTLLISNGGKVTTTFNSDAGLSGSSNATITVTGTNSSWNVGRLRLGEFGDASATVSQGGAINITNGLIVADSGSSASKISITDAGSHLMVGSTFQLANQGEGTLVLSNGGQVTVNAGSGTIDVASNAGGTGTIVIGAAAGDAAVAAGALNAATVAFGPGTGNLVFNHTNTDFAFAPDVTGNGTIFLHSGTTNLTGSFTAFTGRVDLLGGTLNVNTDLSSAGVIDVATGAVIGGTGTLAGLNVLNGGSLAPGNSIGTLNIAGNTSLSSGSTYRVEIDSTGRSDRLSVGGTLTINPGASVLFSPENGTDTGTTYTDGRIYTIATAAGGVSGTFGSISDTFAFLSGALSYDARNVFLTISRDADFVSVAQTTNQAATASAIQATGAGNALFNAILVLGADDARSAFDLVSGEIHPSAKSIFVEDSRHLREAALDRLNRRTNPGKRIWGKLYGGVTSLKGDANTAKITGRTGGLIAGYDAEIDSFRFGTAVQIGRTSLSASDRESSGTSTDYGISIYGSSGFDGTILAFGGAYTRHNISINRDVAFGGPVTDFGGFSERLSSSYNAATTQLFGKISHDFMIDATTLTPFAELSHIMHKTDSFTETGGVSALNGAGDTFSSTFATIGVDAVHKFTNSDNMPAILHGTIGWRHAFNTDNKSMHNFAGGTGFNVHGARVSTNAFVVEAGLNFAVNQAVDLDFNYNGQIGIDGSHVHSAKAVISAKF